MGLFGALETAPGTVGTVVAKRTPKLKTFFEQTSMQRPQFVQLAARMIGGVPLMALSAGRMTCCSGQTAKQSMQSLQAARSGSLMRTRDSLPIRL